MQFRLLLLCYLISSVLFAGTPVLRLSKSNVVQQLNATAIEFAEDPGKTITLQQASQLKYNSLSGDVPNFGFSNSSYWFRTTLVNIENATLEKILEIKNPNIDFVSVFFISHSNDTLHFKAGDLLLWSERPVKSNYFQFKFSAIANDTIQCYINVQNSGEQFHVPMSIGNADHFTSVEKNEQIIFGTYFGIVVFALLLNLFFYFVLLDNHLLFYIGYLLALLLLQLSFTGIGFQYLWKESVYLANHANPIFANLSVLSLMYFTIRFLKTDIYLPRVNRFLVFLSYILVLTSLLAFIPNNICYRLSVLSINVITLILNIVIIPVSIYIWKNQYKPARFFTIAFIVLSISVFLFILKNFGVFPSNVFSEYGLQIGSACEVLLLTLAIIDRFKQFKDESLKSLNEVNRLKTEANIKLEQKVEERTKEITRQKHEIEEKQKEILDSIHYAQRIQKALMASDNLLQSQLKEYFVLYKPKDIVSGDFYWSVLKEHSGQANFYLAVCDCTGHGVPGAFMSLLNTSYLNEAINEKNIAAPHHVFNHVRKRLIENISQDGAQDGMDGILLRIQQGNKLQYAAAHNAPLHIRDGVVLITNCDKMPIGKSEKLDEFSLHEMDVAKGDMIYFFTDGYADQFGGPKGKKYKNKNLQLLLAQISGEPVAIQKEKLEQNFEQWKGNLEQVDDVLVIGIKITS